jgi:HEAT repeat protein
VQGTWGDLICGELAEHAADCLDELIAVIRNPRHDDRVRRLLVAAISEGGTASAVPFLAECLAASDESIRDYAVMGLKRIGTKEARTALWQSRLISTGR